jgi:hypothetical protein
MTWRTKLALCVGIDYPGTEAALYGCKNDAKDWTAEAQLCGYDTVTLLDEYATKANIIGALKMITAKGSYWGRLLWTFSGHGTPVPDRNGDEVDGFDEAIVPVDYKTAGVIVDDEIAEIMAARRYGTRWCVIADSCFSGTLHRAVGIRSAYMRPRYLPPVAVFGEDASQVTTAARVLAPGEHIVPRESKLTHHGVLLSGCAETEVAYDARMDNGRFRGAFTAAAVDTLQIGRPQSYAVWHTLTRINLPSDRFPQTPQLQGSRRQIKWPVFT